jgi:general secretion pathway protein N
MKLTERLAGAWRWRRTTTASTVFADSTVARAAWDRRRRAATRAALWGAAVGALVGAIAFAPAAWLAEGVAAATGGRLLLAEARGTVWNGSAVAVLTGGTGSRDAVALPGRMQWKLGMQAWAVAVELRQACCIANGVRLLVKPSLGRVRISIPDAPNGIGQWPAAWLSGLGTPFNTMQLGGSMRLASSGAAIELVEGRVRIEGSLSLDLVDISSRVSTLESLGSYRLAVIGGAGPNDPVLLQLSTTDGALRLTGSGQWAGSKFRFSGEAVAAEGTQGALDNLLNIIGRRQGARSIISIG